MSYTVRCMAYFHSEQAKGRDYPPNDQLLILLQNIHPTWRDTMKKRYSNIVNQDNIPTVLPAECQMSSIAVTLGHWCHQECLDQPHISKSPTPSPQIFSLDEKVDEVSDDDSAPTAPPTQPIFKIDTM